MNFWCLEWFWCRNVQSAFTIQHIKCAWHAYLNYLHHKDGSVSHYKLNCLIWTWWWGLLLALILPLVCKKHSFGTLVTDTTKRRTTTTRHFLNSFWNRFLLRHPKTPSHQLPTSSILLLANKVSYHCGTSSSTEVRMRSRKNTSGVYGICIGKWSRQYFYEGMRAKSKLQLSDFCGQLWPVGRERALMRHFLRRGTIDCTCIQFLLFPI